ncbi:MAG: SPOR domain-containing protein [Pseudomonadaceae bacterium]|nr:SPOR domain-containing protein [Pseudomonadaceae bacterium]
MSTSSCAVAKSFAVLAMILLATLLTSIARADDLPVPSIPMPTADALVDGRYTIQLLALPSRDALEAFVLRSGVSGLMAKQIVSNGEPRYVLFTGSYSTRAEAVAAAQTLPASLATLTPWIRPLDPLLQ